MCLLLRGGKEIQWIMGERRSSGNVIRIMATSLSLHSYQTPITDTMSIPTNFLTATETQALLAEGKVTPSQVIQDHQARYQERDVQVHAWVHTNFDNALAAPGDTK
jgi:hypothetical protein